MKWGTFRIFYWYTTYIYLKICFDTCMHTCAGILFQFNKTVEFSSYILICINNIDILD